MTTEIEDGTYLGKCRKTQQEALQGRSLSYLPSAAGLPALILPAPGRPAMPPAGAANWQLPGGVL